MRALGEEVRLVNAPEIYGVVTHVGEDYGGEVYEFEYWHEGARVRLWVRRPEITGTS